MQVEQAWSAEPDLVKWLEGSRLNMMRGLLGHAAEPKMQEVLQIFGSSVGPGLARLEQYLTGAQGPEQDRIFKPTASA